MSRLTSTDQLHDRKLPGEYEELLTGEGGTHKEKKRDACWYLLLKEEQKATPGTYAADRTVSNQTAIRIFKALEKDGIVYHYERSDEEASDPVTAQETVYYLTHPKNSHWPTKIILDHHNRISRRQRVGMPVYDERVVRLNGIAFIIYTLLLLLQISGAVDVVIDILIILGLIVLAGPLTGWMMQWLTDKQFLGKHPLS